ncbi:plant UBX domain-containing protein 8-like [Arachis ipaensis]|uniref:plant UBX domain-containing protein 8-like n=1 Tax=Arachis ipaensis TaxID=130454 RepID=UPI000A2B639C|nr:plant UBX domain-containing protein 8-like [Arachis ipaensis]
MATPSQNDVAYFMQMTGAPESLALQRIEESGGNVNEAVNAHFRQYNNTPIIRNRGWLSWMMALLLSVARMFRPSLLLNKIYKRRELIRGSPNGINGASVSNLRSPQYAVSTSQNETENSSREARDYHYNDHYSSEPSVSQHVSDNDVDNDVEEDMIRAAIEASINTNVNGSLDDDDLAEALSLSLKTAAEEEEEREFIVKEIISKIEQSKAATAEGSDMNIILPHEFISQE